MESGRRNDGKKVLLLINSSSGQEKGKTLLYNIVEEFAKKNCEATVFPILPKSKKLNTENIVHKYRDRFDLIVCVGRRNLALSGEQPDGGEDTDSDWLHSDRINQ